MKVAAYQAPLLAAASMDALALIPAQIRRCEAERVTVLCCPEAILGGLSDYAPHPARFAIEAGRLDAVLAPLASRTVTTIVGFTELGAGGRLYNSAAVLQQGAVTGVYRKLHPAIRRSLYSPGDEVPVFQAGELTFGIVICNDSNVAGPASRIAAQGATVLFVPTNNALPTNRPNRDIVADARRADVVRAVENGMWVVRADVAGRNEELLSFGSSAIVDPHGIVVAASRESVADLLIAEVN